MPSALVPVADGVEEIETVSVVDTLRRGGVDVTVAAVGATLQVEASRKVKLVADTLLQDVRGLTFDAIVLPGGLDGARALSATPMLIEMLKTQNESRRLVGAICAAPALVLQPHGLIGERKACCYPSFIEKLSNPAAGARVTRDGNLVTSVGPGSAIEFGLVLLAALTTEENAAAVGEKMLVVFGQAAPTYTAACAGRGAN
eukprot:Polyplicarium_translucidae@DN3127_c0_g2_i3.p1